VNLLEKTTAILAFVYHGEHHIPAKIRDRGHLCEINIPAGMATFDFDGLTRLVIAAHGYCARVEIAGSGGPRRIKLYFHDRQRVGCICDRHPSAQDLADRLMATVAMFPAWPDGRVVCTEAIHEKKN
jgi:hypothetical protein